MEIFFKNFGKTPAYIDNIQIDGELDSLNSIHRFGSLIGNMIAPGQKFTSSIQEGYKGQITLTITYSDRRKNKYTDKFVLDATVASAMLYTVNESNNSDSPATAIIFSHLHRHFVQNSENACGFSLSTPRVLQRSSDILVGLITFLPSPHLVYHAHDP